MSTENDWFTQQIQEEAARRRLRRATPSYPHDSKLGAETEDALNFFAGTSRAEALVSLGVDELDGLVDTTA